MNTYNTYHHTPTMVIVALSILFVAFFTGTILVTQNQNKIKSNYRETQATITLIDNITDTYYDYDDDTYVTETNTLVYVTFEVDGVEYKDIKLNYFDITMKEGKTIDILYNISDPTIIKSPNSSFILMIVLAIISTILLIATTICTINNLKHKKLIKLSENNNQTQLKQ